MDAATITEPARETPVVHRTDVLVVGSGPGGLAAARAGADVALVERFGCFGGNLTALPGDGAEGRPRAARCQPRDRRRPDRARGDAQRGVLRRHRPGRGVAAAVSLRTGRELDRVDTGLVQAELERQGVPVR